MASFFSSVTVDFRLAAVSGFFSFDGPTELGAAVVASGCCKMEEHVCVCCSAGAFATFARERLKMMGLNYLLILINMTLA